MSASLSILRAIVSSAKQEAKEHRVVELDQIALNLSLLKPLTQNLEPSMMKAYLHQINVLEEIIKKKKEDLTGLLP